MTAASQLIPAHVAAQLLVDTGASQTTLDKTIIAQLGIAPTGTISVHTPSTGSIPVNCAVYDVEIGLDGAAGQHIPTMPVAESDFSGQGIHGLLGRDFLRYGHMTYCGHMNVFYISF